VYAYCIAPPSGGYKSMEWAEDTIQRLRKLWDEGLSTAAIGRQLGVTKNAVVGKAHRLRLPQRESPIRYTSEPRPRKPRTPRVAKDSLPLLACLSGSAPPPAPLKVYVPRIRHPEAPMALPTPAKSVFVSPPKPCCWPLGDPKDKENFRFCDEPSKFGRPYCRKHCEIAYIPIRDRREDEAA
jgi:GcrA cell cycle regulator